MLKRIKVLTCADIPEMVLVRAHFNGLIKSVYLRESEVKKISSDNKETVYEVRVPKKRQRGDYFIENIWKSNEEIINESFNAILLTLPPDLLGSLMGDIFNLQQSISLSLVNLEWEKDIGSVIGDPDIVLSDAAGENIFLIELKIQAKKTNGKYSLQQHTKYSNLIQLLKSKGKNVYAALLAPSININESIVAREIKWFETTNNTLKPSIARIDGKPSFVTNKTVTDYPSYLEYQSKEIERYQLNIQPDEYSYLQYISFPVFREKLIQIAPHLEEPFNFIDSYSTM